MTGEKRFENNEVNKATNKTCAPFDNAISSRFYWNLIQIKIEMKGKLAMAAQAAAGEINFKVSRHVHLPIK